MEKEIEIELPIPKNQWLNLALLEALAKDAEREKFVETAKTCRIVLEKERESRTVRIKGKNVDDLDLEKLGNLIQQANEKGSKFNLKGFLKKLKRPRIDSGARKPTMDKLINAPEPEYTSEKTT